MLRPSIIKQYEPTESAQAESTPTKRDRKPQTDTGERCSKARGGRQRKGGRERRRVGEVPRPSGSHRGNRYTHSHTHTQPHIHFPFSIMKTIRKHFPLVLHEPWPSSSGRDECADFWSWSGALQVLLNPLTWSPPRPSATPGITWQFSKSPQSALATLLITTTL